ncbi:solute carrier family 35 member G1 [Folsomia candida]|uniref:EamA domain-containing protein n=1 Tax=Folsomia candida TaxID=158441 RepID=A0A226F3J1_FOLCA|nr:solute carrier family 35 member G1 [Folsomia candida]OXA63751.1 hypothetical protein Fcan01_03164 [Folsomia candida]
MSYLTKEKDLDNGGDSATPFLGLAPPPLQLPVVIDGKALRSASICSATLHVFIEEGGTATNRKCSSEEKSTPVSIWKRYLGVGYTLLAVNMLALTNTIMKKYSHVHPFNVGIWYSPTAIMVAVICIMYTAWWEKQPVSQGLFPLSTHKKNVLLILLRGVLTSIIFYLTVAAFYYITAADLRTVISAVVIAVFIFGWMFLGEKCGVVPTIVSLVALCGIGIMTRPPILTGAESFDTGTLIGISLAFGIMVIIAIHLVVIRYLSEVHHGVGNLIVMVWGLVQGVILSWAFGHLEIPPFDDILGLSISGLCLGLAMTFLVLALQNEEAGVVALVRTSEVIFVFFWQWVIVGTQPDIISMVGATLVISGVISVTLRKWVGTLPKDNPTRRRLRFILM